MLIYVDQVSERFTYVIDFVFQKHGLEMNITNDKLQFQSFSGQKLNYSEWDLDSNQLIPSTILFEEHIDLGIQIKKTTWQSVECLKINGIVDPFAALFFVLVRYEEYLKHPKDEFGRFQAKSSCLSQFNWLQLQIVERWIEAIISTYFSESLELYKKEISVQFVPTFDIDNTYAFQWKEGVRGILSAVKDRLKRDVWRIETRKKVNAGLQKDPYDSYDYLRQIAKNNDQTRFFWLLGDFAEYDRNIAWNDRRHQALIRDFSSLSRVGLHPSVASFDRPTRLFEEVKRLESIVGIAPKESRQHFLKMEIPHTYRKLINAGFQRDFTMGYAQEIGFRAGTAHTHLFFDLTNNETTQLEIIPFAYMDGTLLEYLKLNPSLAIQSIEHLVNEVKQYGGVFCCVWHNETIAEAGKWKGWRSVYEFTQNQFEE